MVRKVVCKMIAVFLSALVVTECSYADPIKLVCSPYSGGNGGQIVFTFNDNYTKVNGHSGGCNDRSKFCMNVTADDAEIRVWAGGGTSDEVSFYINRINGAFLYRYAYDNSGADGHCTRLKQEF